MDYYDPFPPGRRRQKKPNRASVFFAGMGGVLAGAGLVWGLFIAAPGLIPGQDSGAAATAVTGEAEPLVQTATTITTDVTEAVDVAAEAVVGVTNLQTAGNFWSDSEEAQAAGTGSGVIYKVENGTAYVITNHHVIDGASEVEVTLTDGSKVAAEILGSDIWTDLAVLSMDAERVGTVAELGDSSTLNLGEPVIAIGSPLGLSFFGSITTGVISGLERVVPVDLNADQVTDWQAEVLQTDAAINPGNSGGALINLDGKLVGINSMKVATSTVEGIGFAIPINSVIPIIESLEATGTVERPAMGVTLVDLMEVPQSYRASEFGLPADVKSGVVIESVIEGTPAAAAGLQPSDVIVEMDGEAVDNMLELRQHLYNETQIGDTLMVSAYRNGELMEFELVLTDSADM
ncbi:S1C family serine protease [Planococcus lenghuensis]|uniref:2-alkenal reductase n=1 Tax=Planococcus lenghuensis TaxID=2213202 RepID=A0A1Q2L4B3_9BACL|nr:trypsin-like peptidase domain-containing protein [Planococcus lenghuensis]AQQ54907.1 2-alkenal reductase [Planococcus lenghuensis]